MILQSGSFELSKGHSKRTRQSSHFLQFEHAQWRELWLQNNHKDITDDSDNKLCLNGTYSQKRTLGHAGSQHGRRMRALAGEKRSPHEYLLPPIQGLGSMREGSGR